MTDPHSKSNLPPVVPTLPAVKTSNGGLRPESPLQPPPAQQAHIARARTYEQGAVSFSLRMQYKGEERTIEIPLTQDMMRQLARISHTMLA